MILRENLGFEELCELVFKYQNEKFFIFNHCVEYDQFKDFKKSTRSQFEVVFGEHGELFEVIIRFKRSPRALPLWLIKSNDWVLRIEKEQK